MLKLTHKNSLTSRPFWIPRKKSLFLSPAAVVWWLQAASIRPPERTLRHSKTAPNCVPKPKLQASGFQKGPFATAKQHLIACQNRAQTYPQKVPIVPSEFLEKISFLSPAAVVWRLQAASIRPPEWTLRRSKTAPNCVPKPYSNLPTKTA